MKTQRTVLPKMLGRFPIIKDPFPKMLQPFPIIMGMTLHPKPLPEIKEQQGDVKYRFFEGETNCE